MCGIELFYRWLLLPVEAADTHPFRCKEDKLFWRIKPIDVRRSVGYGAQMSWRPPRSSGRAIRYYPWPGFTHRALLPLRGARGVSHCTHPHTLLSSSKCVSVSSGRDTPLAPLKRGRVSRGIIIFLTVHWFAAGTSNLLFRSFFWFGGNVKQFSIGFHEPRFRYGCATMFIQLLN
jgi:hypothetical protein